MKIKPEGFLWLRKGDFDEDKFAADLGERIPKLFAERGYVDFQLDRDTLMIDPERGKAMIQLDIREGDQYRVKAFEVVGNRRFPTEQIAAFYPFTDRPPSLTERARALIRRRPPATTVFDLTRWEEATQQVSTLYNNEGYIYAQVNGDSKTDFMTCKACHLDNGEGGHYEWQLLVNDPEKAAEYLAADEEEAAKLLTDEEKKLYAYNTTVMARRRSLT